MAEERVTADMSELAPLFVLGCPRSGTSLTRNLMRRIPGIFLPSDEFQVLPAFVALCERNESAERIAEYVENTVFASHMRRRGFWPGREQMAIRFGRGAAEDFRELVFAIAEKEGLTELRYWGDKTPENVFQLALIARLWPEARVIHVLRDPRATVLSMKRAWGRSVLRGAVIWRDAIRSVEHAEGLFPAGSVRVLRYEALVADPVAELAGLADWLDVNFEPDTLEGFTNEERWGSAAGRSGVVAPPPDNWREGLTTAQLGQIEAIVLDEMKRMDYAPVHATTTWVPGRLRLRLAKFADGVRVLRAYVRERGFRAGVNYKLRQWRTSRGL